MDVQLELSGGAVGPIEVTPLDGNLYRLEESVPPFVCDADEPPRKGDVIELRLLEPEVFKLVRVAEPAPGKLKFCLVSDESMPRVCQEAELRGIGWERFFGGCLYLHLPPDEDWDVESWLTEQSAPNR